MHSFSSLPSLPTAAGLLAAGSSLLGAAAAAPLDYALQHAVTSVSNSTQATPAPAEYNQNLLPYLPYIFGGSIIAGGCAIMIGVALFLRCALHERPVNCPNLDNGGMPCIQDAPPPTSRRDAWTIEAAGNGPSSMWHSPRDQVNGQSVPPTYDESMIWQDPPAPPQAAARPEVELPPAYEDNENSLEAPSGPPPAYELVLRVDAL